MDVLDLEFEEYYQRFLAEGGLDTLSAVSEGWERHFRQTVYCPHSLITRNCRLCRSQASAHPYGNYHID